MSSYDINRTTLLGTLGRDPEVRSMSSGDKMASFSVATGETWTDKASGERKQKTEWHNVVCWGAGLVDHIQKSVRKGDRVYVEGQLATRKWRDQHGNDRYSTEIVVRGWGGRFLLLTDKRQQRQASSYAGSDGGDFGYGGIQDEGITDQGIRPRDELDDNIPF